MTSQKTPESTSAKIQNLKLVDLHRHLEGSLRPETLWDFHCRENQSFHGGLESLRQACTIAPGAVPGFKSFLSRFDALRFIYGGLDALERLAAEAVADAADDGVIHLELRFSPVFFARRLRVSKSSPGIHVPPPFEVVEQAADAIVQSARREATRRGISLAFIITLGRHFGAEVNRPSAELLSRPIGTQLSALDLAGDESYPACDFVEFFRMWKAAGRGVTIHAGEDIAGPGAKNVYEALELGADRIGHGVLAANDPVLIQKLIENQITLELCLTSNVQTGACSGFSTHPLKRLLDAGVRVTINTDDPCISVTTLRAEYTRAEANCGLTHDDLLRCTLNAANAAYLPKHQKVALIQRIENSWD